MSVRKSVTSYEILVAVDLGRSSAKIIYDSVENFWSFPFLISRKKSNIASAGAYLGRKDLMLQGDVDGEFFLFGDTARLLGDNVFQHTEGDEFMLANCKTTLFAIAKSLQKMGVMSGANVHLVINLTFDNYHLKEQYQGLLRGSHTVDFKDDTVVTFTVDEKLPVLYQGYSGFLEVVMGDSLKVPDDFVESENLVIDFGRQTIDFIYIEECMSNSGKSIDFGTYRLYQHVIEKLKVDYNIVKEVYEVEKFVIKNKPIQTLQGNQSIEVMPLLKEASDALYRDVEIYMKTFLAKRVPDNIILLGGGAVYFVDTFKANFRNVMISDHPREANTIGMFKFLQRILKQDGVI